MKKMVSSPKLMIFEGDKTSGLVERTFGKSSLLEKWKLFEVMKHYYNEEMG